MELELERLLTNREAYSERLKHILLPLYELPPFLHLVYSSGGNNTKRFYGTFNVSVAVYVFDFNPVADSVTFVSVMKVILGFVAFTDGTFIFAHYGCKGASLVAVRIRDGEVAVFFAGNDSSTADTLIAGERKLYTLTDKETNIEVYILIPVRGFKHHKLTQRSIASENGLLRLFSLNVAIHNFGEEAVFVL